LDKLNEEGLSLADNPEDLNSLEWTGEISLLIGTKDVARILTGRTYRINESILAVETIFGWVVFGGNDNNENQKNIPKHHQPSVRYRLVIETIELIDRDCRYRKDIGVISMRVNATSQSRQARTWMQKRKKQDLIRTILSLDY